MTTGAHPADRESSSQSSQGLAPGAIVHFRNRDWVLLSGGGEEVFRLRPLTGTADDVVAAHRLLCTLLGSDFPSERVSPSQFPLPSPDSVGDARSVHLLWQGARLLLREGAAPFRSLGRISVRPRTYQLVPLMLALKQNPVRLLIADDVGVGKTIEAGLIVRELWERGEIRRFAVLCPPYLCDAWQKELREKFHFDAEVIAPGTIGRLERRKPPERSVYDHYPVQVISIDFVKTERNRHQFLLHPPDLVIVDEAHGVTGSPTTDRQLRYELVNELASAPARHVILLTATPHSGIPEAFQRLLGLLHRDFENWDLQGLQETELARLANHFVQRTRKDIQVHWEPEGLFPRRQPLDVTYTLSPSYRALFQKVYDFCTEIVQSAEGLKGQRRRMRWWSALTLLRCVMSSPQAAHDALDRRRRPEAGEAQEEEEMQDLLEPSDRAASDEVPTLELGRAEAAFSETEQRRLRELQRLAEAITPEKDHKLQGCLDKVRQLLGENYNPVIWCIYVKTAEYVAEKLQQSLAGCDPPVRVLCLTGRVGEEERREKVEELMKTAGPRVLVATDCLSEGINLQKGFNAVLHYDLPWNPNRLEQREGRVDRFEQPSPVVKVIRYYGADNPVDIAVRKVLLDKASTIRQMLGIHVPVPEGRVSVDEALVQELFGSGRPLQTQLALNLSGRDAVSELNREWDLDAEREKQNRTRFAQRALRPEEVLRELEATDEVLGSPQDVREFVLLACQKLGLQVRRPGSQRSDVWEVVTEEVALRNNVPEAVRRALPTGPERTRWIVTFTSPCPEGAEYLGRNHPFVAVLARYIFEQALSGQGETVATRCGAIRTRAVTKLTTLLLLRPRFQLTHPEHHPLLAEEVLVVGQEASGRWLRPNEALNLLRAEAEANIPLAEKRELVSEALLQIKKMLRPNPEASPLWLLLTERAGQLEESHRRIRQAVHLGVRGLRVRPHWPPDVLGLLVFQPVV